MWVTLIALGGSQFAHLDVVARMRSMNLRESYFILVARSGCVSKNKGKTGRDRVPSSA